MVQIKVKSKSEIINDWQILILEYQAKIRRFKAAYNNKLVEHYQFMKKSAINHVTNLKMEI